MTGSGRSSETDRSRDAPRPLPPPTQHPAKAGSLFPKIRELFGKLAEFLTGKPTPYAAARRKRRDEDTRRLYKRLAMKVLAPVMRSIATADDFNCFTPPDALDETQRLMLRERRNQDAMQQPGHSQVFSYDQQNNLSPRF